MLMENRTFQIEEIHVPAKRRRTLDPARVAELAESMLEEGQKTPIRVRADGARFVLVEGLHRLEACKALGEETIVGVVVQTPGG
jgi:ParB-like chromosome segregation protein Spo0J